MGAAGDAELIQRSVPVNHLEPDVVRHVPVDHWSNSPEFAASQRSAIKIGAGEPSHQFPCAPASIENGMR